MISYQELKPHKTLEAFCDLSVYDGRVGVTCGLSLSTRNINFEFVDSQICNLLPKVFKFQVLAVPKKSKPKKKGKIPSRRSNKMFQKKVRLSKKREVPAVPNNKTMCETLSTSTRLMNILNYGPSKYEFETKASISEPDNGHKTETITKLDLKLESERLKTFKNFKSNAVTPEDLAKAGFYFLNNPSSPDLVKCAFCKAEICSWESGDDALQEHIRWSPNCPFAKERDQSTHPLAFLRTQSAGQDVCGNAEILTNSIPESQTFRLLRNMVGSYGDEKSRLESFENWPKSSKLKPEVLAKAGFYYRGVEDHTICFECGGALRDWKDDDDPWEQHAMWFPSCSFLKDAKGLDYIKEVRRKLRSGVPCNNVTKEATECKEQKSVCEQGGSATPDDVLLCKICDSNERNVIFRPCNHIIACRQCSLQMNNCPVCRERIVERMKVFLS